MAAAKKLFIGTLLDTEKRILLNQSPIWKQIQILPKGENNELLQVHFQGKEYLGLYCPAEKITLAQLEEMGHYIQGRLRDYCPECELEKTQMSVFSQLFIS